MKCFCCGKTLPEKCSPEEVNAGWHKACIKKFFGTTKLPIIDISEAMLEQIAIESTTKGYTVPGVQKKLSLHLTQDNNPRLTLVNYPTGYILKPQTTEYRALPEAEYLVMRMAAATRIKTVPFALVRISSEDDRLAYITKRIDRVMHGEKTDLLAMEDFCQLENRLTADKYKGSYERCMKVIEKYSADSGLDMADMFLRIVFSFVVGNSDMHLKNFSLVETEAGSNRYHLSEAYDMLPVNVIIPADSEEMALALNGKKRNIRRKDFLNLAETAGILRKSAEKMINKVVELEDVYVEYCRNSYLPSDMKERLEKLIQKRIAVLKAKENKGV